MALNIDDIRKIAYGLGSFKARFEDATLSTSTLMLHTLRFWKSNRCDDLANIFCLVRAVSKA